jgi:1-aminocyclopropane-1-carboxylate deaminase/D-cysteine desulfhydrase-like pyridoxal-dependent ACC family enzyme
MRHGRFRDERDIVFLHTGGLFGLFAQREQALAGGALSGAG